MSSGDTGELMEKPQAIISMAVAFNGESTHNMTLAYAIIALSLRAIK